MSIYILNAFDFLAVVDTAAKPGRMQKVYKYEKQADSTNTWEAERQIYD